METRHYQAFYDLPAEAFPLTLYAYPMASTADENPLWTREVAGPGLVHIPTIDETGQAVRIVVKMPNGGEERKP